MFEPTGSKVVIQDFEELSIEESDKQLAEVRQQFFQSLKRVRRIQEIAHMFATAAEEDEEPCTMAKSISEVEQFVEE